MKLAFVTTIKPQNGAFYGAETSLKYLIESLRNSNPTIEISIIIRQSIINSRKLNNSDKINIQNFFNLPTKNIHYVWIPYVTFPIEPITLKSLVRFIITNVLLIFYLFQNRILFRKFDHIHINNTHLYLSKYFTNRLNYSQHIRDFINHKKLFNTHAKFLICIDKTTSRQINNTLINKTHILPNLYFPANPGEIDRSLLLKLNQYKYKFCLVGQIAKIKGVEYVVREFASLNYNNACLIVIGGITDQSYYLDLKYYASQFENIFLTGDVPNVSAYYEISDFNIRGDEHFCIGRTTIESAIHGLINILPLKSNELPLFESDSISDLIKKNSLYYEARKNQSLKQVLINCIESNHAADLKGFENPSDEVAHTFYSHIIA